jgi:glycosyltransferase involved in cell wall biosynthesis
VLATVIVVPVLRRPHRVQPLLESIERNTPAPHRVLFVASPGDDAELAALEAAAADHLVLDRPPGRGDYARKINLAYRSTREPLLFLGADDLAFHPGWLERAQEHLAAGIHVVGTNDLGNARVIAGDHATHSIVTRWYVDHRGTIDEDRKVLHEGYEHEFVDDEFVATAKKRRAWAFAPHSIVEHLHPSWGKAPTDPLYDDQDRRMRAGRRLYLRRRRLWK